MEIVLLVLAALVLCAIFGVGFLAAIADFCYDVFMKVFQFAFGVSSCLIRSIALVLGFYLLCLAYRYLHS